MSAAVTLLMAIHAHQPVGNFGFVFEQAYAKAYDPFLRVLERHPGVRVCLHYSGCLLDWLLQHRPDFIARLRALVQRDQVELLASGYYEPILPLIPEADRQGQMARMRQALRAHFRTEAAGLWLTERVWEPELPQTLARAGIRYTIVDTNQFLVAKPWLPRAAQVQDDTGWDLLGCYATDYAGSSVTLFPASKRLRYWMPFQPVGRTIDFLRRLQRDEPVAVTFADDGEKFGFWPKTYHWVYEERWPEQFFQALEQERAWLSTATFRDYLDEARPLGHVYLPCGSYEEMLEWSGGNFRNFFAKYPEANAMQQKMLRISRALQSCTVNRVPRTGGRKITVHGKRHTVNEILRLATQELYAGQCNCAYWHGVFGGLYLSHLRRAVYRHLIEAERLAHRVSAKPNTARLVDVDADGHEEALLTTSRMGVVVDGAEGGTITDWSLYEPGVNLVDTLTRRPEPYHEQLRTQQPAAHAVSSGGPASIHEILGVKEQHLESAIVYDDHRRSAFVDYALQRQPSLTEAAGASLAEQQLWPFGAFRLDPHGLRQTARALSVAMTRRIDDGSIRKVVRVLTDRSTVECHYALEGLAVPVVGLEFNLGLRDARYLRQPQRQERVTQWYLRDEDLGGALRLEADPPATVLLVPLETVSESEDGLERTYQGLCLLCLWAPEGSRAWRSRLRWTWEDRSAPRTGA